MWDHKCKVISAVQGSFTSEEYLTWLCSSLIKARFYHKENLCSLPFLCFWRVNHNLNTQTSLGYLKKNKNAFQEKVKCGYNKLKSSLLIELIYLNYSFKPLLSIQVVPLLWTWFALFYNLFSKFRYPFKTDFPGKKTILNSSSMTGKSLRASLFRGN